MSQALTWKQAVVLGMVVLMVSALAIFGVFAVGDRQGLFSASFHVYAGFPRVQGVEVGTRVRIQGVDAGEVVAVQSPAVPGQDVVLRMRLGEGFRSLVRKDAVVEIAGEGLLGAKVIEILPGTSAAPCVENGTCLAVKPSVDVNDLLSRAENLMSAATQGNGTVAKLIHDPEAYSSLVTALKQSQHTLASVQQNTDALKKLPVLRGYVEDPVALLVRPSSYRYREVVPSNELFEPGRAVLTEAGKQRLDALGPWLESLKFKDSEVVVAGFSDPERYDASVARTLTRLQSQAVSDYLTRAHRIQKLGWWSSRKVTTIGLGGDAIPSDPADKQVPDRIELLVYLPQSS